MFRISVVVVMLFVPVPVLANGDSLPPGAVMRLGSDRFAHPYATDLAFSADGKRLLAWGFWSTPTRLFDAHTGKILHDFPPCWHAALSPDGTRVALFRHHWVVQQSPFMLFDTQTGKKLADWPIRYGEPAFSPDNKMLVVLKPTGEVAAFDTRKGECLWISDDVTPDPDRREERGRLSFSADGKILYHVEMERLRRWNTATGKHLPSIEFAARTEQVTFPLRSLASDGKSLAEVKLQPGPMKDTHDFHIAIRSLPGMQLIREWCITKQPIANLTWHHSAVRSLTLSDDGQLVAWAAADFTISVADVQTGKIRQTFAFVNEPASLLFSPDGTRLAVADHKGMILMWDVLTGKSLNAADTHLGNILDLAVTRDGRTIVTAGYDQKIRIWHALTGQQLRSLDARTWRFALAVDGTLAAFDKRVDLWNIHTGKQLRTLKSGEGVSEARFGPGNSLYAYCYTPLIEPNPASFRFYRWDTNTGEMRAFPDAFVGGLEPPSLAAFSPDGRWLAHVAADGNRFHVIDCATYRTRLLLGDSGSKIGEMWNSIVTMQFAPDSRHLATLDRHGSLNIWDTLSGRKTHTFACGRVESGVLAWSPDGRYLLTSIRAMALNSSPEVRLWELESRQIVWQRLWPEPVTQAIVLAQGKRLVTHGFNGYHGKSSVLIWSLAPPVVAKGPLERHWQRLAGNDAKAAYESMWAMSEQPEQTLTWLQKHVRPEMGIDRDVFARLLNELGSDRFAVRDAANRELRRLGPAVEGNLHRATREPLPLEVRRRVEGLLAELAARQSTPDELRNSRAVTVLAWMGTPAARRTLVELSQGISHARITQQAEDVLGWIQP